MAATVDQESLADLGRQLADDAARLVKLEIELAKAELREKLRRAVIGIALVAVAAVLAFIALIFALATIPEGALSHVFDGSWPGWLITGGFFLLVAILLGWRGARRLLSLRETPQTVTSIKENVEWAKRLTKRSGSSS